MKKFIQSILLMLLVVGIFPGNVYSQTVRSKSLFNMNWKFHKGDTVNAQNKVFSDGNWSNVTLPHDWSIAGPYDKKWASATAYLPGGIGWYRKTFMVPVSDRGKKIFIYFNGIYKDSKVWINGHFLGERPNGFVSFYYDITPYIEIGSDNVISVRVDHSEFADSRWYTGSGIYRNVYLIVTGKLHIGLWGISASSTDVSSKNAMLNTEVSLVNETDRTQEVVVENQLSDKDGRVVAKSSDYTHVAAGKSDTVRHTLAVPNPQLWSTNRPVLYGLKTIVKQGDKIIDEKITPVGIRSIRFDADKGFFLNGRNIKLKGVCLHDDAGCLGVAVPSDVWKRRLEILKAAGCNAIRLSHNPHAPELYDLCDEMGFLLIDEAFDEWELGKHKWIQGWNSGVPGTDGYHEYFKQWADRDLRDMILRDRNHPSVIMWSIGNEIDYPNDPYSDEVLNHGRNPQIYGSGYMADHPSADNLGRIARHLVKVVKEYDTTHPVTAGLAAVVVSNKVGYAQALDVVGYNYQEYRYREDHETYPERKIYGSENGQSYSAWKEVTENEFVAGQFLWTGIDYLGEAGKWPSRGSNAGLLDLAGFKKPAYYFRKSIWTESPMIYIGTTKLRRRNGRVSIWANRRADPVWNYAPGDTVQVNCFTNCKEAELRLNGQSLGRKQLNDSTHVITWLVPFHEGTLAVKGFDREQVVAEDQIRTYKSPVRLVVSSDVDHLEADGQSVAHITIKVVDKSGNLVYDANNEITCEIEGSGRLLGLEGGDNSSHESYTLNHRKAFHGKLLAYIQSSRKKGNIKVTVSAAGIGRQVVNLVCNTR